MTDHSALELPEAHRELIAATVASALAAAPVRKDVKRAVGLGGVGVLALAGALWTWATNASAQIARHEELLVGSGKSKTLPEKVDDLSRDLNVLSRDVAVERQAGLDRDRRQERMESTLDAVALKVGAKK